MSAMGVIFVKRDISESIGIGILLALSGGLMDAYSYIGRGGVFANAQTGNILLFSVHLSEGNLPAALHYLCPVAAFAAGIVLVYILHRCNGTKTAVRWRRSVLWIEAAILFSVGFIPADLLANSLISFVCGAQVECFRHIDGNSIATTMCIGNLRSAVHAALKYTCEKKTGERKRAMIYAVIILSFATGAVAGNLLVGLWHEKAIWGSSALLTFSALLLTPLTD